MANKDKLLASAQKFLSKGQIPKAIGEYKKLIDAFPKDVRNRQKLAELLSRDKRNDEALGEYEVVANHYTETGFYLKSIAVFKQMQKIEPSRVDIYHRLAELNEKQGLIGNALTEYRNLVSFYEKNDMHSEAIEVLEKMAALDSDNLNFSLKIAECLMASGQNEEAFEKFQVLIEPMAANGEHLKIVKLYERFLDICPEEGTSRLPLAKALLESGSAEKAIQILKGLLKHTPEDPDINLALTDAYVANQDLPNARLTLKHLLKQKAEDLELREYYVRVCIDAQETERARDRLEEWKDTFFQADRVTVLQGFYEELRELLPGDAIVSGTLSAIYEAVGDTAKLDELDTSADVSSETDVTTEDSLVDDAIEDVETLDMVGEEVSSDIDLPPLDATEREGGKSKANESSSGLELDLDLDLDVEEPQLDSPSALEEAAPVLDEDDAEIEVEIDLDGLDDFDLDFDEEIVAADDEPATEQVVTEEALGARERCADEDDAPDTELELDIEMAPDLSTPVDHEETDGDEQELSLDEVTFGEVVSAVETDAEASDESQESPSDDMHANADAVDESVTQDLEDDIEFEPFDSTQETSILSEDVELKDQDEQDVDQSEQKTVDEGPFTDDLEIEAADDLELSEKAVGTAHTEESEGLEILTETEGFDNVAETEELEFAQETEILEAAEEIEELEPVEEIEELEAAEEIEELEAVEEIEELEVLEDVEDLEDIEELEALDEIDELEPLAESSSLVDQNSEAVAGFAAALNVDAELEEAEFYLQQGLFDDAERVVKTLLEYRPELSVLQDKLVEINQGRQAAEAESESADFVDIMSDLQDDDLLAATDFLDSFGSTSQDEGDVSQRLVSELDSADTESHYNLGIAYKEMGLFDDAVAEFEKASVDPARALDCITLKGQCYMESGEADAAMAEFRSGLIHESLTDEARISLNFEIGMLHQMNGQLLEALEAFQLVAEQDSFFRDVSELITNLRRELGLEDDVDDDDDGPQGNRDRVSYV